MTGVRRLQPKVAGVDAIYRYVNASSYHRSRPYTRSFGANLVIVNVIAFGIVVSVTIVDVPADFAAGIVVVGAADDDSVALLTLLLLFLLLAL